MQAGQQEPVAKRYAKKAEGLIECSLAEYLAANPRAKTTDRAGEKVKDTEIVGFNTIHDGIKYLCRFGCCLQLGCCSRWSLQRYGSAFGDSTLRFVWPWRQLRRHNTQPIALVFDVPAWSALAMTLETLA